MVTGAAIGALRGVVVLDVGTQTPGRLAAHLLGELGASVVRIERPASGPTPASGEALLLDRGKRSLALDLGDARSREAFERIVARADALVHTYRPATAARLGLDGERLLALNPRLVVCALSGFGDAGGAGDRPAYDLLLLAASHGSRSEEAAPAVVPSPLYATYATAGGGAVALAVLRPGSCEALFRELGRPDLADAAWRGAQTDAVESFLRASLLARSAREWVDRFAPMDVEIAEVKSIAEAFDDPVLRARGMVFASEHPSAGALLQIGHALQAGSAPLPRAPAPGPGADGEAILRELLGEAGG